MVGLEKEIVKEEKKIIQTIKKNGWIISTVVLAVLVVIFIIVSLSSGISETAAQTKLVTYLNEQTGGGVTGKSITSIGDIYQVNVTYQGQEIPVYMTKDGKYMLAGLQSMESTKTTTTPTKTNTQTTVPKTDKPKADLYVFSYCPYGLQVEKALAPVYDLLKDKADINLVQIGAMHGEFEKTEAIRQLCIEKNYDKDKLWAYLNKFYVSTSIQSCQGSESCLSPLLNTIYSQTGIDASKINSCMSSDGPTLYAADTKQASSLSVSGSPTWIINGVQAQVGRSPEEVKKAICAAFTTQPSECSQTLSTAQASVSFGSGTGSGSAASCG